MNRNVKGIIVVIAFAGLGYFAYKKFIKIDYKKIVLKHLNRNGVSSINKTFVNNVEKGYIDKWGKALQENSQKFNYNNKDYSTQSGTAIV